MYILSLVSAKNLLKGLNPPRGYEFSYHSS